MTVIDTVCEVQTVYTCTDGSRFHETLSPDGSISIELNDAEMNPVYFHDLNTGEGVKRILTTSRAFSFSELLRSGRSEGAYTAEIVMMTPFPRPAALSLRTSLTGEEKTLNGITFKVGRAEVGIGLGTGGIMAISEGPVLVDPERGLLFVQSATMNFNGAVFPVGEDIVSVLLPGDPGFQPDRAPDACESLLSSAVARRNASQS